MRNEEGGRRSTWKRRARCAPAVRPSLVAAMSSHDVGELVRQAVAASEQQQPQLLAHLLSTLEAQPHAAPVRSEFASSALSKSTDELSPLIAHLVDRHLNHHRRTPAPARRLGSRSHATGFVPTSSRR